jgi:cell division protein FtsL
MSIEVHFEKRINNLNVIREADTRYNSEYLRFACLCGVFLLCLFFYGWQHYRWMQNGYRIEAAQKHKEDLAEMNRQLRLERESLRDLGRIDNIARHELGMVAPSPGQLVIFSIDAPLTIPRPAQRRPPQQEQLAAKQ